MNRRTQQPLSRKVIRSELRTAASVAFVTLLVVSGSAAAQTPSPPATQALTPSESTTPPETKPGDGTSLDEMLGIDPAEQDKNAASAAEKDAGEELKRQLNEAAVADSFVAAIEKMSISAELLDVQFDPGLGTQRVQEDIMAKLAQLIDAAKKSKSKSKSKSSSSSSSQQPKDSEQNQDPGKQQSQQKPQNPQAGNQRSQKPGDSREGEPSELSQGDINTVLEEQRTEWGNLPQRVRDMLMQGRREKYSSLYNQLTGEYYKRLAEETAP